MCHMTQPLALLFYEKLLPGSQLLNRLQDLGYRVQTCNDVNQVPELAKREKPMLVFTDLLERQGRVPTIIRSVRNHKETEHIPIIAFAAGKEKQLQEYARMAGATVVVNEEVLLHHLDSFMDQALQVD